MNMEGIRFFFRLPFSHVLILSIFYFSNATKIHIEDPTTELLAIPLDLLTEISNKKIPENNYQKFFCPNSWAYIGSFKHVPLRKDYS